MVLRYVINAHAQRGFILSVSVKSNLTSGASVRLENAVSYSAGNEGEIFVAFSLKPPRCRDPALPAIL